MLLDFRQWKEWNKKKHIWEAHLGGPVKHNFKELCGIFSNCNKKVMVKKLFHSRSTNELENLFTFNPDRKMHLQNIAAASSTTEEKAEKNLNGRSCVEESLMKY